MNLKNTITNFGYIPLEEPTSFISQLGIFKNMNSFFEKLFYKEPIFQNTEMTIESLFGYKPKFIEGYGLNFSLTDEDKNIFRFENVKAIDVNQILLKNFFYANVKIEDLPSDILKDIKNGNLYFITSTVSSNKIMINEENEFSTILFKNEFIKEDNGFYTRDDNGLVIGVRLNKLKIERGFLSFEFANNIKTLKF